MCASVDVGGFVSQWCLYVWGVDGVQGGTLITPPGPCRVKEVVSFLQHEKNP